MLRICHVIVVLDLAFNNLLNVVKMTIEIDDWY